MWRRWLPLVAVVAVQVAILAAIPLRRVEARMSGTDVTLRTVPVDPFDPLSGYYVTLRYEVEDARAFTRDPARPDEGWLLVERATPAWRAVEVPAAAGPPAPGPDQVVIRLDVAGLRRGGCTIPSACRFYIPEARREAVAAAMRESRGVALVDLRVDDDGDVALLRLRVGDLVLAN